MQLSGTNQRPARTPERFRLGRSASAGPCPGPLSALLLLGVLAGCGGGPNGGAVRHSGVKLENQPREAVMTVGQRLYLGAAAEGASETGVQWFVLGAESGSVTPEGLYTAPYRPGTTFVRTRALADPSVTAATVVTVHAEPQARELRVESPAPEGSGSVRMTAIFQGGTGEVSPGVGPVESGRSFEVKPAATTTYTLRVSNDLGERAETSVQVEVPGPPEAPGIYAPSEVQAGLQQVAWLASENLAGCEWSIEGGSFLGGDPHPGSKAVAFVAAGGTAFALKAAPTGITTHTAETRASLHETMRRLRRTGLSSHR